MESNDQDNSAHSKASPLALNGARGAIDGDNNNYYSHNISNNNNNNDDDANKNGFHLDTFDKDGDKTIGNFEKSDGNETKKEKENKSVSFFSLFRYASKLDKAYIAIGSLFAISLGAGFPILVILMGKMTNTFIEYETFNQISHFGDLEQRHEYYKQVLLNIHDIDKYYNLTRQYFSKLVDRPELDPEQIRIKLSLSVSHIVSIYNDSIFQNGSLYVDNFRTESTNWCLYMAISALLFAVANYFSVSFWALAARNQVHYIKLLFFRSIIHQDISWFDTKASGDFATKITSDLDILQEGIGDKVALCIMSFSTVLFSLGVAFYHGWELTLVIMAVMPVMGIAFMVIGKIQARFATNESTAYGKAGAIAEEVINLVRTVYAFGGQEKEMQRYFENIEPAKKSGIKRSMFTAISMGIMWFSIYASYGWAFWYGVKLILRSIDDQEDPPRYNAGSMMIIFFNVLMGTFSVGQTSPYFESIARACGGAGAVFKVIERKPEIDSLSQKGEKITNMKGLVEFRNVHFTYISRKEVPVLRGIHLVAKPGETVALVGSSGCGKSTIIQLIQRFYDPNSGDVLIDGINLKDVNVGSLRDQIGVVGQEPVLFGYSITDNIKFGNPEASMNDIIQAAKDANAYDFIQRLPEQFNTLVGDRGSQLSGGQKQRIAIARALVRKPKILLLDESTSALDSESESIVQAALDKASIGRTTFIVAHRLSTIRNADKIIVIESGRVKEVGTHNELIGAKGVYYQMAKLQQQDRTHGEEPVYGNYSSKETMLNKTLSDYSIDKDNQSMQMHSDVARANDSKTEQEKKESDPGLPVKRLAQLVKPDRYLLITATLSSFIVGLSIPIYSYIFGEILAVISILNRNTIQEEVTKYALIYLGMGIVAGLLNFTQIYLFGICSENLTYRLRKSVFTTILRQEVAWFDKPSNSTGALCARLSHDTASVHGATGSRLSIIAQTISILSAGVVLSIIYNYKLGLLMTSFIPVILVAVYFQMKILLGYAKSKKNVTEEATKIAVETISNIRTVASLHQELTFWFKYENALDVDFRRASFEPHLRGITFGVSQSVFNLAYAISLFYGSRLIIDGELNYGDLFKSTEAVIFGTNMIGHAVAFSPDYQKGKVAAISIFKLLDRVPRILISKIVGKNPNKCDGNIHFEDVNFSYPNRPEALILKGINFSVSPGQTVALVGTSGCGKSTCTQLLERFYDVDSGQVTVDNDDICNLNIPWLRGQIGIVSQEPILFDKSIKDNIAYGDNTRDVSMEEVVRAAEQANIHNFIQSLPAKYDTSVGDKGVQLSGGQKQRIAIARALIRNPRILLLDEATSALDSESEKVVQKALDEARHGRTCLIIAHRLSTIQDVDKIVVIENGKVVEEGTHQQLMELHGAYYHMYNTQCGF